MVFKLIMMAEEQSRARGLCRASEKILSKGRERREPDEP
jgi:hypothetical protein